MWASDSLRILDSLAPSRDTHHLWLLPKTRGNTGEFALEKNEHLKTKSLIALGRFPGISLICQLKGRHRFHATPCWHLQDGKWQWCTNLIPQKRKTRNLKDWWLKTSYLMGWASTRGQGTFEVHTQDEHGTQEGWFLSSESPPENHLSNLNFRASRQREKISKTSAQFHCAGWIWSPETLSSNKTKIY